MYLLLSKLYDLCSWTESQCSKGPVGPETSRGLHVLENPQYHPRIIHDRPGFASNTHHVKIGRLWGGQRLAVTASGSCLGSDQIVSVSVLLSCTRARRHHTMDLQLLITLFHTV